MYPSMSWTTQKIINRTSIEFTIFFLLFLKIVNSIVVINSLDHSRYPIGNILYKIVKS